MLCLVLLTGVLCAAGNTHAAPISCVHPTPHLSSLIGPFEISNADSTSRIRFLFAGQLRAQ